MWTEAKSRLRCLQRTRTSSNRASKFEVARCSLTRQGRVRTELLVVLLLKVKWSRQYFHTFDQTYSIQREEEAGLKRAAIITIPGKNYNNYNPI